MDARDVARILTKAAAFDQRTVGDGDVLAWLETIGDLDLDDALAAVTRHYRESTEFLRPAHLRETVAELQRERHRTRREHDEFLAATITAIGRGPTEDRSTDVDAMVEQLRVALGDYDRNALRRQEWVREQRRRDRAPAEPNPLYTGPPPPGGWPEPDGQPSAQPAVSLQVPPEPATDVAPEEPQL